MGMKLFKNKWNYFQTFPPASPPDQGCYGQGDRADVQRGTEANWLIEVSKFSNCKTINQWIYSY